MEVRGRRIVIDVSEADGREVHQQLAAMIHRDIARGLPAAPELLRFADQFGAAVQASAGSAEAPQMPSTGPRGTRGRFRGGPFLSSSAQPVRLTVREAAHLADVSEGFMRRTCRRGDVEASRAWPQSAWAVDIASLAAWMSARRRKEHDTRKAA